MKCPPTQAVGPTPVLVKKPPMPLPRPTFPGPTLVVPAIPTEVYTPSSDLKLTLPTTPPDTENRLFSLVQGACLVRNCTNPKITKSCWLCYASNPPYYEGVAQVKTYNKAEDNSQCPWGENRKLTLAAVSGNGLCLEQVPHDKR